MVRLTTIMYYSKFIRRSETLLGIEFTISILRHCLSRATQTCSGFYCSKRFVADIVDIITQRCPN